MPLAKFAIIWAFINIIHDSEDVMQNIEYAYYLSPTRDVYPIAAWKYKEDP
jgi:hypothetical protein